MNNNLKEGWEYARDYLSAYVTSDIANDYISNVQQAIDDTVEGINQFHHNNSEIGQLQGFTAEEWHAGTFNIDAAIKKSDLSAVRKAETGFASVDVSVDDLDYSLKFYRFANKSVEAQCKNYLQAYKEYCSTSKTETSYEEFLSKRGIDQENVQLFDSIYKGQYRLIPSDQIAQAKKDLQVKINSIKDNPNRVKLLESYKECLDKLCDRVENKGISSTPLTREESAMIAKMVKEKELTAKDLGIDIITKVTPNIVVKEAMQAGISVATITLALELAPILYEMFDGLIKEGKLSLSDFEGDFQDAVNDAGKSFSRGLVGYTITAFAKEGYFGDIFKNLDGNAIGGLTVIAFESIKDSYLVATKQMSYKEMGFALAKTTAVSIACNYGKKFGSSVGSKAGAAIVTAIVPEAAAATISIGSAVGSFIGGFIGASLASMVVSFTCESGFTCFGLSKNESEIPLSELEKMGVDIAYLELAENDYADLEVAELQIASIDMAEVRKIEFKPYKPGIFKVIEKS